MVLAVFPFRKFSSEICTQGGGKIFHFHSEAFLLGEHAIKSLHSKPRKIPQPGLQAQFTLQRPRGFSVLADLAFKQTRTGALSFQW